MFLNLHAVRDSRVASSAWVSCVLMGAYFLGLSLGIVSLFCLIAIVLNALYSRRNLPLPDIASPSEMPGALILSVLILLLPFFVIGMQEARIINGTQGVDFGIYEQTLRRFFLSGYLETSLLGTRWTHFLTHHFSPYLYLFGVCLSLLRDEALVLLIWHAVGVGMTLFALYKICRELGWGYSESILTLAAFSLLPARRIGLLWEVHDEVYAVALIAWAMFAFISKRTLLMYTVLLAACLIKETMWLVLAVFAVMAFLRNILDKSRKSWVEWILPLIFGSIGIAGFLLYTKILPGRYFHPSFNGFERIGTLEEFLTASIIKAKIWWAITLFLPLLPLLLKAFKTNDRKRRFMMFCILSLPAAPFMAAIVLSKLPGMYEPYNYYSIIPSSVLFIAALSVVSDRAQVRWSLIVVSLIAATLGNRVDTYDEMDTALRVGDIAEPIRWFVPHESIVIVGEEDVPLFYQHKQLMRFFHANRANPKFDYIVQRKSNPRALSLYLRSWSAPCFENDTWIVRCAMPSVRP